MSTWKERVQGELAELTDRTAKLRKFITTEEFRGLSNNQCRLLTEQSHTMMHYADILTLRLSGKDWRGIPEEA